LKLDNNFRSRSKHNRPTKI